MKEIGNVVSFNVFFVWTLDGFSLCVAFESVNKLLTAHVAATEWKFQVGIAS